MQRVLTAQGARTLDHEMIENIGIPGTVLMENAAEAVCTAVKNRVTEKSHVIILCGCGNNGGDGLAILRKLIVTGISAEAILPFDTCKLVGDARINYDIAKRLALPMFEVEVDSGSFFKSRLDETHADIFVDALFGTGLMRDIMGEFRKIINTANSANVYRIAVDIPSGVDSDTGKVMGACIKADETITFQTAKRGHFLFPGREHTGKLTVAKIGMVDDTYDYGGDEFILDTTDISHFLPYRKSHTHKGDNGKALIVAGSEKYVGAAVICTEAALRTGTGLLHILCPNVVKQTLNFRLPEVMADGFSGGWDTKNSELFEKFFGYIDNKSIDCIALGPGMGDGSGIAEIISAVLSSRTTVIIDADSINCIAKNRNLLELLHEKVIITPHPGEMSRLIDVPTTAIAANPVKYATEFSKRFGANIVLKGATSVISTADGVVFYNLTGNAGLAKGGSGDALTGIMLGLLAQKIPANRACAIAPYLLGEGADMALMHLNMRVMTASDVINEL